MTFDTVSLIAAALVLLGLGLLTWYGFNHRAKKDTAEAAADLPAPSPRLVPATPDVPRAPTPMPAAPVPAAPMPAAPVPAAPMSAAPVPAAPMPAPVQAPAQHAPAPHAAPTTPAATHSGPALAASEEILAITTHTTPPVTPDITRVGAPRKDPISVQEFFKQAAERGFVLDHTRRIPKRGESILDEQEYHLVTVLMQVIRTTNAPYTLMPKAAAAALAPHSSGVVDILLVRDETLTPVLGLVITPDGFTPSWADTLIHYGIPIYAIREKTLLDAPQVQQIMEQAGLTLPAATSLPSGQTATSLPGGQDTDPSRG